MKGSFLYFSNLQRFPISSPPFFSRQEKEKKSISNFPRTISTKRLRNEPVCFLFGAPSASPSSAFYRKGEYRWSVCRACVSSSGSSGCTPWREWRRPCCAGIVRTGAPAIPTSEIYLPRKHSGSVKAGKEGRGRMIREKEIVQLDGFCSVKNTESACAKREKRARIIVLLCLRKNWIIPGSTVDLFLLFHVLFCL